jgi:hypothetical protein
MRIGDAAPIDDRGVHSAGTAPRTHHMGFDELAARDVGL